MRRPRLTLGARLALAMVGSLTVLLAALGFVFVRYCRESQEQLILESEDRLGDLILRATRLSMLRNDVEELSQQLPEIGRMRNLERVRIYDKAGTIRYSSAPPEVGTTVDLGADACDRCHATAEPLSRLSRPDRTRIYRSNDERIMGMIHPIRNEPACSAAPCHVHPPDREVLGVLDVQMSLASIDSVVAERIRSFLALSVGILALVSGLSVYWVWRTVHRPVKRFLGATRAISAGNLEERIPETYKSELGELAVSFNQMTSDLREARRESDDWARTLEQRVEEKSTALRRAQDEMLQVEKMASLGKLAAIVAHEINNPLAGIRTYAKLLLKRAQKAMGSAPVSAVAGAKHEATGIAGPETVDWLARIESEAGRCGEIVRNLLSFARRTAPHVEPVDVNELVTQSIRLVQHQLDLSSVSTSLELAEALPRVECDPQQIKQALLAMLINACEAMPSGGELYLRTRSVSLAGGGRPEDAGGGGVEIRIRDTGVGMDEETRKHIFEPFFTTKDPGTFGGGTGLGLAVVYGILRSHGGKIAVESTPGGGSVFHLVLPRLHTPPAQGDEEP